MSQSVSQSVRDRERAKFSSPNKTTPLFVVQYIYTAVQLYSCTVLLIQYCTLVILYCYTRVSLYSAHPVMCTCSVLRQLWHCEQPQYTCVCVCVCVRNTNCVTFDFCGYAISWYMHTPTNAHTHTHTDAQTHTLTETTNNTL